MRYEVWVLFCNESYAKEVLVKDFSGMGLACSYARNLSSIINIDDVKKVNVYSNDKGFRRKLISLHVEKEL